MENRSKFLTFIVAIAFMVLSCNKGEPIAKEAVLLTFAAASITFTTAISGGVVSSDGGSPVTTRGVCWSKGATPTISDSKTINGAGKGSFSSDIINLVAGTTYFVRSYATSAAGTGYGQPLSFTTLQLPTLGTSAITGITLTTAVMGGNVTSDGGAAITARGACWSLSAMPTISDSKTIDGLGTGTFTSNITHLATNTKYQVRAYVTNFGGTSYGNEVSFSTPSVADVDGNFYNAVTIGTQVWLIENLKTTKYRNGDPLPQITDGPEWNNTNAGAYCNQNNDPVNSITYGRLYNWYAVKDSRSIAPPGWHVPSDGEWLLMVAFLGGESVAGGKLKEAGTSHWQSENVAATNETGFTALPGGLRVDGTFSNLLANGDWWSSTESDANKGFGRYLYHLDGAATRVSFLKGSGFSVRCLKD